MDLTMKHSKHGPEDQTAFLNFLLSHLQNEGSVGVGSPLSRAQREEKCTRRALWLAAIMTLASLAGLCYAVVFLPDFFRSTFLQNWAHPVIKLFSVIGLGSLISSTSFLCCWIWYLRALRRRQAECRLFIQAHFEDLLSKCKSQLQSTESSTAFSATSVDVNLIPKLAEFQQTS